MRIPGAALLFPPLAVLFRAVQFRRAIFELTGAEFFLGHTGGFVRSGIRQQRRGARHQLPRALSRNYHKRELAVRSLIENGHASGTSKRFENFAKPFIIVPPAAAGRSE